MSDFWVSQQRHWCKYCKKFIANNKPSIQIHENGLTHKTNVEEFLRNVYKKGQQEAKEAESVRRELQRIEKAARLSVGGPVSTPTAKPAAFKSSAPKGIDAYGYGPLGSVPAPPPLSVLAAPAPEQPVEGREEWAIRSNIAQPGEWETVTPSSQSSMAAKDQHKKTDTATTHDQKPEFQDDEAEDEEDLRNFKIREKELPLETDVNEEEPSPPPAGEGGLFRKRKLMQSNQSRKKNLRKK